MPPEAEEIIRQEAIVAGVTVAELMRVTKDNRLAPARREVFRRMRDQIRPTPSYATIGEWTGRSDMTVWNAVRVARRDRTA
jgi:hypothetical protein